MTLTGTSARFELLASAELSSANTTGNAQIGTPSTAITYTTAPDIAYSMMMSISAGDTLTLNLATGAVTGTVAGVNQVETATVVAASGCTANGTCNVVVTGNFITGSPVTVPVALTTATHTTATLVATAIRTALSANSAISDQYTIGGSTAAFTLTDKSKRLDDSTLNIAIPSGLGITAAPSSANTTAGVGTSMAYRITGTQWDTKDYQGIALPTATKLYSTLIRSDSDTGATIDITCNGYSFSEVTPFVSPKFNSTGNSPHNGGSMTFSPDGDVVIYIDIQAGT